MQFISGFKVCLLSVIALCSSWYISCSCQSFFFFICRLDIIAVWLCVCVCVCVCESANVVVQVFGEGIAQPVWAAATLVVSPEHFVLELRRCGGQLGAHGIAALLDKASAEAGKGC